MLASALFQADSQCHFQLNYALIISEFFSHGHDRLQLHVLFELEPQPRMYYYFAQWFG